MKRNETPDILSRIRNMKFRKELTALLAFFVMISTSYAMIHPGEALNNNVARSFMFFEEEQGTEEENKGELINAGELLDKEREAEAVYTDAPAAEDNTDSQEDGSIVSENQSTQSADQNSYPPTSTPAESVTPVFDSTAAPVVSASTEPEGKETSEPTGSPESLVSASSESSENTETADPENSSSASPEIPASTDPSAEPEETEEPKSLSETHPAVILKNWDEEKDGIENRPEVVVVVDAPEGALPKGTKMEVTIIETPQEIEEIKDQVAEKVDKNTEVKYIQAVDITFKTADGTEIEPLVPIKVSMKSDLIKKAAEEENTETDLIHIKEDKEKEVKEAEKVEHTGADSDKTAEDEITFESASFSVYVIVGTELVTDITLPGSDDTYDVHVTYGADAQIPENVHLEVNSLLSDSKEYVVAKEAIIASKKAADEDFDESQLGFAALDISIVDENNNVIEPAEDAEVKVSIKIKRLPVGESVENLSETMEIQHLNERTGEPVIETVASVNDVTVTSESAEAEFTVDSFSTYVISWTNSGSSQASENDSITKLILQTQDGTTVQVNVRYVDQDGYRITKPDGIGSSVISESQEYVFTADNLVKEIENAEIIGVKYSSFEGDEVTKVSATGYKSGTSSNKEYILVGKTDKDGVISAYTYVEGDYYYGDNHNNATYYQGAFYSVKKGVRDKKLDRKDVYLYDYASQYEYSLTASYNAAEVALRAAGDQLVDIKENSSTSATWDNAADIYIVYDKKPQPVGSITVHFVDRNGNELTGIKDPDGTIIDGGSLTISSTVDLSQYTKEGYTYANTRRNGYGDSGEIIYPNIRKNNNNLQYTDDGTNTSTDYNQTFSNGDTVYVIMDPVPTSSGSGSGSGGGSTITDLPDPETSKTLTDNEDGTYNLNLSITGKSASKQENKNINVLFVIDNSSSMGEGSGSRLENTKDAVKESAKSLLSNNTTAFPNLVEVAAVSFDRDADNVISWTNSQSDFDTEIGKISKGSGTNWEDGLKKALDYGTGDGDPTYVIFFTDGMPYGYRGNGNTYEGSRNLPAMMAAKDEARAIVNSGRTLYNIFAYGSTSDYNADYLGQLTDYAYNDSSERDTYYKKAAEKDDVVQALAEIVDSITQKAGFENVKLTDGITGLTQSTVITGQAGAFKYYRSGGKNADNTEKYDSSANGGKGVLWTDAPPASYSAGTGVTWDLSSLGQLEDGVTYTVSFTVWPNQTAYDKVAEINNSIDPEAAYNALDQSIKDQITFNEETKVCSLKTNTEAKAEYTTIKTATSKKLPTGATSSGENTWTYTDAGGNVWTYVKNADGTYTGTTTKAKSLTYDDVPSITLDKTTMKVRKVWQDTLTNAEDRPLSITFKVKEDGEDYKDITLTGEGNVWEKEIVIAPGIYVNPGDYGTATIGDNAGVLSGTTGHTYTIEELAYTYLDKNGNEVTVTGTENHYDFDTAPVKPMINGLTTTEGDMIEYLTKTQWDVGAQALVATNTVKDGIYIYKVVKDGETVITDSTEKFKFKITLTDSEGNPVYTTTSISGDLAWRVDKADATSSYGYSEESRGYYSADSGIVELEMTATGRIRIVNIPVGTNFKVEEITDNNPKGYKFTSATVNGDATTGNNATGTTVGNKQWEVKVTNTISSVPVTLKKTDNAGNTISNAKFELSSRIVNGTSSFVKVNGLPGADADGYISLGVQSLDDVIKPNYIYRLTEKAAPDGYIILQNSTYFKLEGGTIVLTDENGVKLTAEQIQASDASVSDGDTLTIAIKNTPGQSLPNTGGPGTLLYTLSGLALILASALMYGFRMRRRERRLY